MSYMMMSILHLADYNEVENKAIYTVKPRNERTFRSSKSAHLTVGQIRSYDAHFLFKAIFYKS